MNIKLLLCGGAILLTPSVLLAGPNFVNGDFENGDLRGWTIASGTTAAINGATTVGLPGVTVVQDSGNVGSGSKTAQIVTPGNDPHVGALLNRVYGGASAVRVGDDLAYGYGGGGVLYHKISQTATVAGEVSDLTDPGNLFFAWAAVVEQSGHAPTSTPFFQVRVVNNTSNTTIYDVAHYETDGGFWTDTGAWFVSGTGAGAGWQVVSLDLSALGVNVGDSLTLEAIARDCTPSAHASYVYLDGFGAAPPVQGTPDGAMSALLIGVSLLGLGALRRRLT